MKRNIDIVDIFFWITLILLVIMLAWWAFGDSPTIQALSFFAAAFGIVLTYGGLRASKHIVKEMTKQHSEQTKVLKDIRNILKKRWLKLLYLAGASVAENQ